MTRTEREMDGDSDTKPEREIATEIEPEVETDTDTDTESTKHVCGSTKHAWIERESAYMCVCVCVWEVGWCEYGSHE